MRRLLSLAATGPAGGRSPRRVPLGADLETVEAAVGWPADFAIRAMAVADDPRRVVGRENGEDQLLVGLDGEGRAVQADVNRWRDLTL